MIHAIVHGKVSGSIRYQEDVLTSCVFGSLDLLPARAGLGPWLQRARSLDGQQLAVADEQLDTRHTRFWPRLSIDGGSVEPDLHLELEHGDIIIEAKYGAGPSGAPSDGEQLCGQLGRQWAAARSAFAQGRPLTLIYVTADWSMPRGDMESMVAELEVNSPAVAQGFRSGLYWLTWRSLAHALVDVDDRLHARALALLRAFLGGCDFDTFEKIRIPARVRQPSWTYGYTWKTGTPAINWSYASDQRNR